MRIKARASLDRLKAMKNKKRKFVATSELDRETWIECDVSGTKIGLRNTATANRYIELVAWTNKTAVGRYTRIDGSFWFENEKDAFKFKLRWGEPDGK
jgi:hypothetical protein